jgi:hypothetical protein
MQTSTREKLDIRKSEVSELRKQIIFHHERFAEAGRSVITMMQAGLWHRWHAGIRLNQTKAIIGQGDWLLWIETNLPFDERTARRYMEIDNRNPNLRDRTAKSDGEPDLEILAKLSEDTVRKHAVGYVPEKTQPEHKGNVKFGRLVSFINMVNEYTRLKQRHTDGLQLVNFDQAREETSELCRKLMFIHHINCPNCGALIVAEDPWA